MTSSDRTTSESKIQQLISETEGHIKRLQNGVDQTRHLWRGQGSNQFVTRLPDELAQADNVLGELRAVVDNPPWETTAQ